MSTEVQAGDTYRYELYTQSQFGLLVDLDDVTLQLTLADATSASPAVTRVSQGKYAATYVVPPDAPLGPVLGVWNASRVDPNTSAVQQYVFASSDHLVITSPASVQSASTWVTVEDIRRKYDIQVPERLVEIAQEDVDLATGTSYALKPQYEKDDDGEWDLQVLRRAVTTRALVLLKRDLTSTAGSPLPTKLVLGMRALGVKSVGMPNTSITLRDSTESGDDDSGLDPDTAAVLRRLSKFNRAVTVVHEFEPAMPEYRRPGFNPVHKLTVVHD